MKPLWMWQAMWVRSPICVCSISWKVVLLASHSLAVTCPSLWECSCQYPLVLRDEKDGGRTG